MELKLEEEMNFQNVFLGLAKELLQEEIHK
jgi:hypothetical protein